MLTTSPPRLTQMPPTTRPYVLLVDDHAPTLARLQEVVRLEGHPCLSVNSAARALQTCAFRRPRVVVTDWAMPEMDGCALASSLKGRYPSIPILLVTGESLEAGTQSRLLQTFTAVFPKPIDIGSFLDRLKELMPPRVS